MVLVARSTAFVIMGLVWVALAETASACSSSEPSAVQAADGASDIVLARVVEARGSRAHPSGYHLEVVPPSPCDHRFHLCSGLVRKGSAEYRR